MKKFVFFSVENYRLLQKRWIFFFPIEYSNVKILKIVRKDGSFIAQSK
jgi:hypothetical protein